MWPMPRVTVGVRGDFGTWRLLTANKFSKLIKNQKKFIVSSYPDVNTLDPGRGIHHTIGDAYGIFLDKFLSTLYHDVHEYF